MQAEELLPPLVLRQIGDASYDRRKQAALAVEQLMAVLAGAGEVSRLMRTLRVLVDEFAFSQQENHRKGALLCLAAATVGIGHPTEAHLNEIVPVVLVKMTDQDVDVRYHACEALYNIAKVSEGAFIAFFNEVFDAMFRLSADSNSKVRNAMQFLDNLVKDIVTAYPQMFDMHSFIPKVRQYLNVAQPYKRRFLISWISVLDSMPDLGMLSYLPQLLDGLMGMLSDPSKEIQVAADGIIKEFLQEVRDTNVVDLGSVSRILLSKSQSQDELTRLTSLAWLQVFVERSQDQLLLKQYPSLLGVVLANICHSNIEVQHTAARINAALLAAQPGPSGWVLSDLDLNVLLATISRKLRSESAPELARLEALRWARLLLQRAQAQVLSQLDSALLPALLDCLASGSETLVVAALRVLADVACCPHQFRPLLVRLLERFREDGGTRLLQRGGALVIRRLCVHLGSERVFTELSLILDQEEDAAFACALLQALNLILLTSPELSQLRELLHHARASPHGARLFHTLYPCWTGSVGALLSLCFLAQAYDHAHGILQCFCTLALPMSAEVLLQLDRLVALLETPIFTFLRLALVQAPASVDALEAAGSSPPAPNGALNLKQRPDAGLHGGSSTHGPAGGTGPLPTDDTIAAGPSLRGELLGAMQCLLTLLPQGGAWRTLAARLGVAPLAQRARLDSLGWGDGSGCWGGSFPAGEHGRGQGGEAELDRLLPLFVARQRRRATAAAAAAAAHAKGGVGEGAGEPGTWEGALAGGVPLEALGAWGRVLQGVE